MSSKDQTPAVGGAGKTGSSQHWFISEIQQMMHALGDCRRPLQESAILVEEITQQQMTTLLYKASDVATMRGAKLIGVEDILFLMRRDKVKLRRLLRYMDMKDMKAAIHRSASVDEEESAENADTKPAQPTTGKRRKVCYEFLSTIDQTGELLDLFEDEAQDDVKYERLLRADLTSRCLDPKQYLEFCEARQVNFARKHKSQRFRDWLLTGVNLEIKPNQHAIELIGYLAYETVAQIVDLSLLVKQDMLADTVDPVTRTLPSISHNLNQTSAMISVMGQSQTNPNLTSPTTSPPTTPIGQSASSAAGNQATGSSGGKSKPKKKKRSNFPHSLESPVVKAIQPSDILESMRRYTAFVGPFASQLKYNSQLSPKLITLSC